MCRFPEPPLLYAYVGNDPFSGVDPTGTECEVSTSNQTYGMAVNCVHPDPSVPSIRLYGGVGWRPFNGNYLQNPTYHDYHYKIPFGFLPRSASDAEVEGELSALEDAAKANPTPGSGDRPASSKGTLNDVGHIVFDGTNPVMSYAQAIGGGRLAVVNATADGHELHPGYIVQWFTYDRANQTIYYHVAGEGVGTSQANLNPFGFATRLLEQNIWFEQANQFRKALSR